MRMTDWGLVAAVALMLGAVALVAPAVGLSQLPTLVIAATTLLTALSLGLHRRTRQAQRAQLVAAANAASQTEALFSIFATIQPTTPLPVLGHWAAAPDLLRVLLEELFRSRPSLVLEASSGASTVVLAHGLKRIGAGGRLLSLEHDAEHAERTRQALALAGLADVATVILAPLVPHQLEGRTWHWYDLSGLPETTLAGLLVVDGPPGTGHPMARYPALPLLQHRLTATAVVVLDDARRPDERNAATRWAERLPGWRLEFRETERGAAILRRSAMVR